MDMRMRKTHRVCKPVTNPSLTRHSRAIFTLTLTHAVPLGSSVPRDFAIFHPQFFLYQHRYTSYYGIPVVVAINAYPRQTAVKMRWGMICK